MDFQAFRNFRTSNGRALTKLLLMSKLTGKCPYFDVMAARLPKIKILKGKPL